MGWPQFVSVQSHYNLLFREEEREMKMYCDERGIAMMSYSALAAGRLSRMPGTRTKRLDEDAYARFKYDSSAEQDRAIVERVAEVAAKHGVTMTEVLLAWLLGNVAAPVVGATKVSHIEGAARAIDLDLSKDEAAYLEEPYVPHALAGVMAQNTLAARNIEHVWVKNGKYAERDASR